MLYTIAIWNTWALPIRIQRPEQLDDSDSTRVMETDRPLPERYACTKGCSGPMKTIGFILSLDDATMWQHEPYVLVALTEAQLNEWRQLIQEADLTGHGMPTEGHRPVPGPPPPPRPIR